MVFRPQLRRVHAWLGLLALVLALLPGMAGASNDVTVYGTGGDGVWLKEAPALDARRLVVLPEGTIVHLLQGPTRSGDRWWAQVESSGTTGWVVADYLLMTGTPPPNPASPAPAPAGSLAPGSLAMVINTYPSEGLRLRAEPSPAANLITILPEGMQLQITDGPTTGANGNPWFYVTVQEKTGWVDGTYLASASSPAPAASPPAASPPAANGGLGAGAWAEVSGTAGADGLHLRAAPGPTEQLLATVVEGSRLHILEGPTTGANGDPWYRVEWNTSSGWVDGLYLVPASAPATGTPPAAAATPAGKALVQLALAQVGKRYVWGGTGPDGFDCSGLMVYVARQALGISLPRIAADQALAGVHVEPDQLAPGDLVFYANTYQPGISHVGIYVGNRQWVTAQDEGTGVVIASLDTPYWKTRYVGARRIG